VAGGAAAAVETGVAQFMTSMLIRAGLQCRRAAMVAIEDVKPVVITPAEMRTWLESDEIAADTDGTGAHLKLPRDRPASGPKPLAAGIQKWLVEHYKRFRDISVAPPAGPYRIITDEGDGEPGCLRLAGRNVRKSTVDPKASLFRAGYPIALGGWPCALAVGN